jgi:muramoyltetrapeptide carboxypeptidase
MDRRKFGKNLIQTGLIATGLSSLNFDIDKGGSNQFPRKIIKPKALKAGDTIGLVTPASPITPEQLEKAVKNIEALGFKVVYNEKRVLSKYGYLAGEDLFRADDLNLMFNNPEIDGIWCVRGGYGTARILGMLNYKVIKEHPKVLIGYSDITALLQAIFKHTGLVCFHGPAAASEFTEYTKRHVKAVLMNPQKTYEIDYAVENLDNESTEFQPIVIQEGIAEGRLIGGNLTLVTSLIGTRYDINYDNRLVFLEDIGEQPYRIDRMITQLLLAGKFQRARGVILGVFLDCEAKKGSQSLSLRETLLDRFQYFKVPVIYGMSFGHIANQFTFPLGINARLNTENKSVTLLESSVNDD